MAGGLRCDCTKNRLLRPGLPAATPRTPIRSRGSRLLNVANNLQAPAGLASRAQEAGVPRPERRDEAALAGVVTISAGVVSTSAALRAAIDMGRGMLSWSVASRSGNRSVAARDGHAIQAARGDRTAAAHGPRTHALAPLVALTHRARFRVLVQIFRNCVFSVFFLISFFLISFF